MGGVISCMYGVIVTGSLYLLVCLCVGYFGPCMYSVYGVLWGVYVVRMCGVQYIGDVHGVYACVVY